MRFFFRFVTPNQSLLELGRTEAVRVRVMDALAPHHKALLIGEAKWTVTAREAPGIASRLAECGRRLPGAAGRRLVTALWTRSGLAPCADLHLITPARCPIMGVS